MQLKALRAYRPNGPEAFTIIELIMVVTLLGIIAVFAIPNYTKSIDKGYRKDGTVNLTSIYAAEQIYYNNNNASYWQAGGDVNAINSNLGLGILPNNVTYQCAANNGTVFSCTA
ncbi:MAG: prepilin-type N-terminal cleavage/methylation domain-containing protein, partial [Candidatus Omnitrophica bacterium]|nr:prepilin-type N-terminal cleavage/methylation domain-containing protein [Candidatus Omnitrophota bacterium]